MVLLNYNLLYIEERKCYKFFNPCRFKDNRELRRGRKYEMLYWDNNATLVVKETEPNDTGKYQCVVSNELGSVDCYGNLTVYSKL